jgi:putative transcriptional regulator
VSPKRAAILNHIRELRYAADHMTQAELAARLGVTRQTVIAIERRQYSPSLEMAFRIARIFDVPLDEVFQFEGDGRTDSDSSTQGDSA